MRTNDVLIVPSCFRFMFDVNRATNNRLGGRGTAGELVPVTFIYFPTRTRQSVHEAISVNLFLCQSRVVELGLPPSCV